jgi:type III pantothenate kinase
MILCLDVGNTQIFAGVMREDEIILRFRRDSTNKASADEYGIFLRQALRENDIDPKEIKDISLCSVVPDVVHSLRGGCQKYFSKDPFVLQAGVKTGLKINVKNPTEVGADRIANSIGAVAKYPDENLIIVDFGTATTFCAVSREREYLGGAISAGVRISMEALESRTARLPKVEIRKPASALGKNTVECIQSSLYYGTLGQSREIVRRISEEAFSKEPVTVIGTGGFSRFFEEAEIFDATEPDLILFGLKRVLELNPRAD